MRVIPDGIRAKQTVVTADSDLDGRYVEFFRRFNQQRFFEAHEVLEELWLARRTGPEGGFYKGLIQLAGAFVHVQKGRSQPAQSLLRLALTNLSRYQTPYRRFETAAAVRLIEHWLEGIESGTGRPGWPTLDLLPAF